MDQQILFLYAALNGYLDSIDSTLVPQYESELYSYYNSSLYKYPLQGQLMGKLNVLDDVVVNYFLTKFTNFFDSVKIHLSV